MPALSRSHAAAVCACTSLIDAFNPDRSEAEQQALLCSALEAAMDATGTHEGERRGASELLAARQARIAKRG